MSDYISTVYDEKRTPKTDYPNQLAHYLTARFKLPKAGGKFLEVGCGRGDFLKAFHRLGFEAHGVDRESSAQTFSKELQIAVCDISKDPLPYPANFFDVVYHKSVIEHLYSPEHLMKETLRVLKPGGKVVILTPDWISQMRVFFEDITHCRPYDETALRDCFRIFGFAKYQVEKFNQLPVLWDYPALKPVARLLGGVLPVTTARKITEKTGVKFFRWAVELMILGYGEKP